MTTPLSVLVTGSAGRIGKATCQELKQRGHGVRGFDRVLTPDVEDSVIGDLVDLGDVEMAMEGMDAAVHLAATPDEADFMSLLLPNNVVGLYNVMEGARKQGVKRLVLASTGQVVSGHDTPLPITEDMHPSPRNWYASTKLLTEAVGQVYAHQYEMSVIVVRPGWCPREREQVDAISKSEAAQNVYFSPADAGRCFACAVEAEGDIRFTILFCTSIPVSRTLFDISKAKRIIGYEPQDKWPDGIEVVE